MKLMLLGLCTSFLLFKAEASIRTLSAVGEKATVDLVQVTGNPKKYYVRISNVDSPIAGQVVLIDRSALSGGGEEFITEGLGFNLRLGGSYSNLKANPAIIGNLNIQGRTIPLKADERTVDLARDYQIDECTQEQSKADAQAELDKALVSVNNSCKIQAALNIQWDKFSGQGMACNGREFLKALAHVCKDSDYKAAVKDIRKVVVTMGKGSFEKNKSMLIYFVKETGGDNTFVRSRVWLEENL